jgi:hypothetical protein
MKRIQFVSALLATTLAGMAYADNDHSKNPNDSDDNDNSGIPEVRVSASDPIAFRGISSGAFLIQRDSTNDDLAVTIALSGSASNGVDYVQIPTSVTIPAGFHSVGLAVDPLGNGASLPNQWATLTIVKDTNYHLGHPSKASVLIKGNEFENQAPSVAITSPTNDTSIAAHSDLTITADASDSNDTVSKVSFYANDRFLGSDSNEPFSITWSNVPPGTVALFARAEDQFGKSVVSSAVHVTATNPPTGDLEVKITTPAAKTSFPAGANIPITAEVPDPTAVQSISFYSGGDLLGTASASPYTITWSNAAPGTYSLKAKATGTNGAVSTSEPVKIYVTNDLPVVLITTPTNNTVVAGPTDVEIAADASDANGIKEVTFYGDSHLLGTVSASPYSLTWSNVPPGKHIIIAKASDTFGAFKTAAVVITISNTPPAVTLTSPADGTTLTAPATIQLAADANDADGIDHVSFWAGNRLIASDKTAPYEATISKVMAGTYTFVARAYDKYGQETTSAPVKVTVAKVPNSHGHE